MTVPKNDKFRGLRALRRALFEHGGRDNRPEIASHSTRNGRRMAKTSRCNSAPTQVQANANGMMQAASGVPNKQSCRFIALFSAEQSPLRAAIRFDSTVLAWEGMQ